MSLPSMRAFAAQVSSELHKEANVQPGLMSRAAGWVGKHQNVLSHGTELAGLGVLAKPSIDDLRKKQPTGETEHQRSRRHAKYELAGLGMLAAPSAIHLAHGAWSKARG